MDNTTKTIDFGVCVFCNKGHYVATYTPGVDNVPTYGYCDYCGAV